MGLPPVGIGHQPDPDLQRLRAVQSGHLQTRFAVLGQLGRGLRGTPPELIFPSVAAGLPHHRPNAASGFLPARVMPRCSQWRVFAIDEELLRRFQVIAIGLAFPLQYPPEDPPVHPLAGRTSHPFFGK